VKYLIDTVDAHRVATELKNKLLKSCETSIMIINGLPTPEQRHKARIGGQLIHTLNQSQDLIEIGRALGTQDETPEETDTVAYIKDLELLAKTSARDLINIPGGIRTNIAVESPSEDINSDEDALPMTQDLINLEDEADEQQLANAEA
jgi:hypothetical protein